MRRVRVLAAALGVPVVGFAVMGAARGTTASESTSANTTTAIAASGEIAYSLRTYGTRGDDGWHIFVMRPDGSGVRNVTRGRSRCDDVGPAWSPDGRVIAFRGCGGINVIQADGTGLKSGIARGESPDWSPSGRRIAFSRYRGGGISVVGRNGTGRRKLTAGNEDDFPNWSPDGGRIAFARHWKEVWVMNADGTGKRLLAGRGASEPAWSPNGRKIVFNRNDGLYLMDSDGSGQLSLDAGGYSPVWSPDGQQLAFTVESGDSAGIWIMNADGGSLHRVMVATDIAGISWEKAP